MYQNSINIICAVFLLQFLSIILINISAVSLFVWSWNEKEIKSAQMCHQHINNFIILSSGIDVRFIKLSKYGQKEKEQNEKQRSTKHTHKTKDRVTRTPLKTGK
jgi:hypothetical protein